MYDYTYGGSWLWHGLFGSIFMIVFWIAVIYFIVWLVRENTNKNGSGDKKSLDVLKERYAKGEITKEQFESMKKDISS